MATCRCSWTSRRSSPPARWKARSTSPRTSCRTAANNQSLGGYGRYTDRPTISYSPLTGDKFATFVHAADHPARGVRAGPGRLSDRSHLPADHTRGQRRLQPLGLATRGCAPPIRSSTRCSTPCGGCSARRRSACGSSGAVRTRPWSCSSSATEMSEAIARDVRTLGEMLNVDGAGRELTLTFGTVPEEPDRDRHADAVHGGNLPGDRRDGRGAVPGHRGRPRQSAAAAARLAQSMGRTHRQNSLGRTTATRCVRRRPLPRALVLDRRSRSAVQEPCSPSSWCCSRWPKPAPHPPRP